MKHLARYVLKCHFEKNDFIEKNDLTLGGYSLKSHNFCFNGQGSLKKTII